MEKAGAFGYKDLRVREMLEVWNDNFRGKHMSRISIVGELWEFLRIRKKWWLLPIVIVLLLVGALLVFAQTSVLAPFIYTLF
jgi:hypothetical protein